MHSPVPEFSTGRGHKYTEISDKTKIKKNKICIYTFNCLTLDIKCKYHHE